MTKYPNASVELAQNHDEWYGSREAHWEDAPGKTVLLGALRQCCPVERAISLLDIACGTGSFLARVHNETSARWKLCGVDFSHLAIEQAIQQHTEFDFRCADATSLDYASEMFDVVTCYGSWQHFPDPERAIAEAGRVLAPGGWLLAMMPTLGIHRTDRDDEGWYEDTEVRGTSIRQLQWNFRRQTWEKMFERANVQLMADSLAQKCGALKPGVFFFGVKLPGVGLGNATTDTSPARASLLDLGRLAMRLAHHIGADIEAAADSVLDSLRTGGKVLACGNGGSAADAQHFVAELVGRMCSERHSLPAISLSSDPSIVTALGNDYGYENVFSRQVEGLGRPGDVLIAISTSGRSPNILNAIRAATIGGLRTVALVGEGGDQALESCDVVIHIPSKDTQRVQELHTAVLHAICEHVERVITGTSLI